MNKSLFVLKSWLVFFMTALLNHVLVFSQDCAEIIPLKPGTQMEIKNYNAKDQLQGTSQMKIISKTSTAAGYTVSVVVESSDEKGKNVMKNSLSFRCEKGVFYWDLNDMMKGAIPSGKGMENMTFKISGTELKFPAKLAAGQKLDDSEISIAMESGGMTMMTINMHFVNRKVEALEKITTPAGTFNCYKITYDIENKGMFSTTMHQVDWMAEGIGMVKTQSFDQKNKLQSYSLLTGFKE